MLALSHHFGLLCMKLANVRVPRPVLVGALSGLKNLPGAIGRLRGGRDEKEEEAKKDDVNPFLPGPKKRGRKATAIEDENDEPQALAAE